MTLLFHRDSWTFLSNFTPCFMGNQGKFSSKIPLIFFMISRTHFHFTSTSRGITEIFPKKYQKFFQFKDTFEFYSLFLRVMRTSFMFPLTLIKTTSILLVPDTGTLVLDNYTRLFLGTLIFWIKQANFKECTYHILRQYWYTGNVPVLTNTWTFYYWTK